ncbi:hypothetical protein G3I24_12590, partial [Micromonospora aurantiaca]|nr:hypothetical protein [Micromonospora aurantiaca]
LLTWFYSRLVRAGLEGGAPRRDVVGSGAVAAVLSLLLLISPWFSVVPVFWLSAVVLSPLRRKRMVALCAGTGAYCA